MNLFLQRHIKTSLFNLLLVAAMGVILRYKIIFYLPFINQKHLLHGHSHFAFSGWVTHALFSLLVQHLAQKNLMQTAQRYRWILNANLITAYGMLISFPLQGYGLLSISFSTASIFVSFAFAIRYFKDISRLPSHTSNCWIKAALAFNMLSSVGAFSLAYMMATKSLHQNWYLAAVYFFLHFQYNGWFLFACMGLANAYLFFHLPQQVQKKIFWLFAAACIPAYVLSALWLPLPQWTYWIVVLAAFSQLAGWLLLLLQIKKAPGHLTGINWVIVLSCIALSIKLLLQLGSTIPALSKLAFGFRPIVIGYLHLILLGVISLFILGYMIANHSIDKNRLATTAIWVLAAGIVLNEVLLMIQGVAAILFVPVIFINQLLLLAAVILAGGIFLLNISQQRRK
jgi:hypothetical protein